MQNPVICYPMTEKLIKKRKTLIAGLDEIIMKTVDLKDELADIKLESDNFSHLDRENKAFHRSPTYYWITVLNETSEVESLWLVPVITSTEKILTFLEQEGREFTENTAKYFLPTTSKGIKAKWEDKYKVESADIDVPAGARIRCLYLVNTFPDD